MQNKFYMGIITLLALFFCTFAYCFAQAQDYTGICVRVLDGDTVMYGGALDLKATLDY